MTWRLTSKFACDDRALVTTGSAADNLIFYRGVAQLVARDVWDVDAAGSNPVTPTKIGFGKQFPKPFSFDFRTANFEG